MEISREPLASDFRQQLIDLVYPIIGRMHYVHKELGPGLREYIYQEALMKVLSREISPDTMKEYICNPEFEGENLESFVKMDIVVPIEQCNVIIECKSIKQITDMEQFQTFGYLRSSGFPIAILVNFGTWPKAQIERYYYDTKKKIIHAF